MSDGKTICVEKEVEYVPSQGLIVDEPIYGKIGLVTYQHGQYVAVLEPYFDYTDVRRQLETLKAGGWVEYVKNES